MAPKPDLTFSQSTGRFVQLGQPMDILIGVGWAGCGEGKKNPSMQAVRNIGPLPRGLYQIGPPTLESTGPFSLRLTPLPGTEMFGRDGFLIHGPANDLAKRGQESHGCPILARPGREFIVAAGARILEVIA